MLLQNKKEIWDYAAVYAITYKSHWKLFSFFYIYWWHYHVVIIGDIAKRIEGRERERVIEKVRIRLKNFLFFIDFFLFEFCQQIFFCFFCTKLYIFTRFSNRGNNKKIWSEPISKYIILTVYANEIFIIIHPACMIIYIVVEGVQWVEKINFLQSLLSRIIVTSATRRVLLNAFCFVTSLLLLNFAIFHRDS